MSERPMLFSTPMVEAIMADRKTQTRRLVKEIPLDAPYFEDVDGVPMACDQDGDWWPAVRFSRIQPGDIIWVRETWYALPVSPGGHTRIPERYYYRAGPDLRPDGWKGPWRPSIHMPRTAARLFLRVEDVRMEHLQDMTPEDCAKDGGFEPEAIKVVGVTPLFRTLWNSTINQKDLRRYGWDASPWVWVYDFERIKNGRA